MGFFDTLVNTAKKATVQMAAKHYQENKHTEIGGKTVSEWDSTWKRVGMLASADFSPYNRDVGLYRAYLGGKIVYIGRAIEYNNGGFRKRLSDYRRDSDSARTHGSGQKMHRHRDELSIDLLVTGSDAAAADVATQLEKLLIGKYQPEWNKQML